MFDGPAGNPYTAVPIDVMNNAEGQALAEQAAREAIVLLKNENNILPFNAAAMKGKTVAVIGPLANVTSIMMGGKNDYCPEHTVSLCEGITVRGAAAGVTVVCTNTPGPDGDDEAATIAAAVQGADAVVLAVGGIFGHEASDRTEITLPTDQIATINTTIASATAASTPLVLMMVNGDPIVRATLQTSPPFGSKQVSKMPYAVIWHRAVIVSLYRVLATLPAVHPLGANSFYAYVNTVHV